MDVKIRVAVPADVAACGRIMHEAFREINERHGFENIEIPTMESGGGAAGFVIANPSFHSVVAEAGGHVVGCCFLDERGSIRGVDMISVDPAAQGQGVGRKLMEAVLEHSLGSRGVRLAQHTFNTSSMALYASLGFEVKEPLLVMCGRLRGETPSDVEVRPMCAQDLEACGALCEKVHGFERNNALRDWLQIFTPYVALRTGRVVAYASAPAEWSANHDVAETGPLAFLLPVRQASFFRWCLDHGLRVVKPMTLMAMGEYRDPVGCYFTSVTF